MAQNFQQVNVRGLSTGIKLLAGAGAAAYGISQSIYNVDGGHRAVIFNRIGGVSDKVYAEGMHFRVPWFQYPIIYEVRSRPRRLASPTGSKDLQTVNITLRVLFRPKEHELPQITQDLGTDYDERVLPSICNEVLKSVVAQFNASQLITQRESVSRLIRQQLTARAEDFHMVLDDVSITDLSFSPEYTAAVEAKQVAQQDAQRAQFTVENAKQERAQAIVKAEGVAKSAELIGRQVRENPGFLQLRKIDAAVKVASVISSSANRVFLDSNALLLNVNDIQLSADQAASLHVAQTADK